MQRPLPVRLQTAWAVSKWRSCSKRKFSQELRPFIQPDLLPSDWRIVCCSLSFSLSSPCTAVSMHHRLSGLHMYTPTLPLEEWLKLPCVQKRTHFAFMKSWQILNVLSRSSSIILPLNEDGVTAFTHYASTPQTTWQSVFVMQLYSTSLLWITECITADFTKSDVTKDHLNDLIR